MILTPLRAKAIQSQAGVFLTSICVLLLPCSAAYAQKGIGDQIGVVRQGLTPPRTTLSGKVVSIDTHPCENTTGYALVGTHLIVEADDGKTYNIHIGPTDAVASIVEALTPGTPVEITAFRTSRLPENQYVATTLVPEDGETIQLRDANLRPFWAGQGGFGRGRNLAGDAEQTWTESGREWVPRNQGWTPRNQAYAGRGQGYAGRGQAWTGAGRGWAGRGQDWGRRGMRRWQAAPCWGGRVGRCGCRGRGRGW